MISRGEPCLVNATAGLIVQCLTIFAPFTAITDNLTGSVVTDNISWSIATAVEDCMNNAFDISDMTFSDPDIINNATSLAADCVIERTSNSNVTLGEGGILINMTSHVVRDCLRYLVYSFNNTQLERDFSEAATKAMQTCLNDTCAALNRSWDEAYITQAIENVFDQCPVPVAFTEAQIDTAWNVYYITYPFLLILGTVGNSFNLRVLWWMKSSSTRVYLTCVAVADLLVL